MLRYRMFVLLLAGFIVLASGCSGRKPVNVLVTLDGKAVEGATVTLVSEKTPASGVTGADGMASLDSGNKGGVPPGSYKVVIAKMKGMNVGKEIDPGSQEGIKSMKEMMAKGQRGMPQSELPGIYNDAKSTPFTLTVPPEKSPVEFKLSSKP